MRIQPVSSRADLARFVELPYRLYRRDPLWVPPLRSEQWAQFDAARNPMLDHCTYQLYLLYDGERVAGRISAFVDRLALEHWKQPIGLFGSFECEGSDEGAQMLIEAARAWLGERGMARMRGPWSFASQEWGLVVEGFSPAPVILAPYNPPCYNAMLEANGLAKAKDLLVYYADPREGHTIPARYLTATDRVQARYGLTVRAVDMRRLEEEVVTILNLANASIYDNWGFYPVTEAEARAMARDLKPILDPQGAIIAEGPDGAPVGFALALPDINQILRGLNGRLFPFGWFKLLIGIKRVTQYRVWALGVTPAYQGKAVDALLYRCLFEWVYRRGARLEINYVLEDNVRMNNALRRMGVSPLRRYRVYEGEI